YSIDYSKYKIRPEARIQQLRTVLNKAKNADLRDPYAAYEAASALALAYDQLMDSLQGAGTGALKTDLTTCKVELSKTEYYYNGKSRKPNVTVKDGKTILSAGTDYYTIYQNNTDAGTAKVIVRGAGDYMGTVTKTFKILPKEVEPEVNLSKASYTWDGKVKTPDVKVKTEEESLTKEDYTVEYSSGRKAVGTYKVAVKLKNNYSGKKTVSFTINPNGTTISKADPAKNGFTVKWKKQTQQTTGYQIQYSTSSGFKSGNKTVTVTPNTATSKKITKLKAKTKYYVRVRTYKTISGKKYYSGWSKAVAVKTK
ncbi:MAG: fibronectin type III domain-containing protein, partial [Parasporobacterium sp.]|nr:fibronectin type III domain-containing protein [Parasporobacterium sp.]